MGSSDLNPDELTPEERGAREERLFQLSEALQASIEAGNTHENSVWAVRFHLSEPEVERVRRGLELLFFDDEEVEAPEYAAAAIPLTPPELPDDYELRGELGRGGMGIVYRVRQVSLDRELALKVLRPGELQAQRAIDRFKREARRRHTGVFELSQC
jgi:serine/threonine protein kinase